LGEEGRSQASKRVRLVGPLLEESVEHAGFLGGDTHALAVDRVEAAYRVAEGQQPARELLELVEMPSDAGGKPEAGDLAELLGLLDRIVDGRGAQLLRTGEKTVPIVGRLRAVASGESHDPAVPFQRQQYAAEASPIQRVKCHYASAIRRCIVRDGEDARGIGDVDPDRGLFRPRPADGLEEAKGEVAAPRGFDNQVNRKGLAAPVAVL